MPPFPSRAAKMLAAVRLVGIGKIERPSAGACLDFCHPGSHPPESPRKSSPSSSRGTYRFRASRQQVSIACSSYLSALEHGEKEPDAAVLLAISREFGKSVDWLLTEQTFTK